nr:unnamed protein product [Callosobruchus analis]
MPLSLTGSTQLKLLLSILKK